MIDIVRSLADNILSLVGVVRENYHEFCAYRHSNREEMKAVHERLRDLEEWKAWDDVD